MKKLLIILLPFITLACTKSVEVIAPTGEPANQLSVAAYSEIPSRAPIFGTTMPTGRTIVFSAYLNASEGSDQNFFTGINFTKKSGDNTIWQSDKYWPLTGTLDFLGYCLDNNSRVSSVTWGSNVAASVAMTLADNRSNQDDLLVGGAPGLSKNSNAVVFKHAQALLTFNAKASVAYNATTNYGITINSITINNVYNSGRVTATRSGSDISFAWSSLAAQASVVLPTMSATNLTTTSAPITTTAGGFIVPSQTETSFTINYTLHNGKDSASANVDNVLQYTYTPASATTWQPGCKYIYNISMTLTGIEITSTVTNWSDQTAIPVNY